VRAPLLTASLLLVGCRGDGNWELLARGGDAASFGLGTSAFADGCAAVFDSFVLNIEAAELIDEDGESAGGIELASRVDLVDAEVVNVAVVPVLEGSFDSISLQLGGPDSAAVTTTGVITCDRGTVEFDWAFLETRKLSCAADQLTIPDKGDGTTELQVPVQTLFVEGANPTSEVLLGEPFIEADTNHDGEVLYIELDDVFVGAAVLGDLMEARVDGLVRSEGGAVCTRRGG